MKDKRPVGLYDLYQDDPIAVNLKVFGRRQSVNTVEIFEGLKQLDGYFSCRLSVFPVNARSIDSCGASARAGAIKLAPQKS